MNFNKCLFFIILGTMISCSPIKKSTEQKANVPNKNQASLNAILWHQNSSEYVALCHQAFNIARYRLEEMQNVGKANENTIIVLDIDETVLDNSPYAAKLLLEGKEHTKEEWNSWVEMQRAEFVPGALNFLRYLQENQFPFVFISNRDEEHMQHTIGNLINNDFFMDKEDVFYFNTGNPDKDERRNMISDEMNVIMLIGDNLNDFSKIYNAVNLREITEDQEEEYMSEFGRKFIMLPNVLYGDWLKEGVNFSNDGSPIEGNSGLKAY